MPRNGSSGSGGNRGGAPRRSMGTASAPPAPRGPPARVPPPSAPVKPPPRAPQQGAGAPAGPSAAGTFGASAAGAVVGTMVGSALARPGEVGAAQGSSGSDLTGYYGKCANEFRALLNCADYNGGDLDRCLQQEDNLQECIGYSRQKN